MLGRHVNRVPNPAEELAPRLQKRGFDCLLSSSVINRYLRPFDILFAVMRQCRNIDVVSLQIYSGPSFVVEDIISWLVKCLGLHLVMVLHGGAIPEFMNRYPQWGRRVLRRADQLVSPSHYLARELQPYGLNLIVIPNGMDISCYPFRLRQNSLPRLTWLRAFHPIYQPEMAVMVVEQLVKEFPDLSLQMIGPSYRGPSLTQTRQLITRLGLESRVKIVGYIPKPELPAWLQNGDIFLNTTYYESFGIAAMEAAACGLPIVTTNIGELSFLWQNGQNALTVGVNDVSGMANAVRRILTDSALAQRLSLAGRQRAEEYDWSNVLPQWEQLFKELVVKKRG
jgi:glycosyltransferase involved in cell wall biosynthesis